MPTARDVLTPDALSMLQTVAMEVNQGDHRIVPFRCDLTNRGGWIETSRGLLFDRRRPARVTEAGLNCCARPRGCWVKSIRWPTASSAATG